MAEFKTKEDYERWKAEKSKEAITKLSTNSPNSNTTEKKQDSPASLKPRKSQKILFLIFSVIAFLSLFDSFAYIDTEVISIWYGKGLLKGLSFCIGLSVIIVLILSIANLYKNQIRHLRTTIGALSISTIIILSCLVVYQIHASKTKWQERLTESASQIKDLDKLSQDLTERYKSQNNNTPSYLRIEYMDYQRKIMEYSQYQIAAEESKDLIEKTISRGLLFKVGLAGILLLVSQIGLLATTAIKQK